MTPEANESDRAWERAIENAFRTIKQVHPNGYSREQMRKLALEGNLIAQAMMVEFVKERMKG